jgi:hypothetical protein
VRFIVEMYVSAPKLPRNGSNGSTDSSTLNNRIEEVSAEPLVTFQSVDISFSRSQHIAKNARITREITAVRFIIGHMTRLRRRHDSAQE